MCSMSWFDENMAPLKTICLMFVILLLAACKPDTECRQTESVRCVIVFECDSVHSDEDTTFTVKFTAIDSVSVQGVGNDSVLYDNQHYVSKLSLPLRSDTTETQYLLTLNSEEDILTIKHENNDYFVSLACGCFVFHEVDTAYGETGLIVNSKVLNTAVQNVEQENVRLYISF